MALLRWSPDRCALSRFGGVWIRSLLACLPCVGVPAAAAQEASKVRIEIQGIDRHLERNVRAVMALARAADTGLISPRRIVQLHARAENDIEIALQPFGYYRPDIDKSLEENGEYWIARYQIDPGPAVRLRSVNVELTGPGADEPTSAKQPPGSSFIPVTHFIMIRFAGGPVDNPGLSIRATRTIADTMTVGIAIGGTLKEPDVHLFSEPPMSDRQVLSYIVTGAPLGRGAGTGANILEKAFSTLGLLAAPR